MSRCAVNNIETCHDPVAGSVELYVEQAPPGGDWHAKLMRAISQRFKGKWLRLPFCEGHLKEVVHRSGEYMDSPDLWAPRTPAPPVFARAGRRATHGPG